MPEPKRFKIFCGSANRALAEEICKFVGVPLGETRLQRFSDGEVHFQLLENVRGADVFSCSLRVSRSISIWLSC